MKFLSTTAKLAGALGAAFLMSTAIANAAPAIHHDAGPKVERHDTRGAQGTAMAKPQFDGHKDGRKFARVERHDRKGHCDKAHRHERHAHKGRHDHHRMAEAGKYRGHGPDRFNHDRSDRDHDRRG